MVDRKSPMAIDRRLMRVFQSGRMDPGGHLLYELVNPSDAYTFEAPDLGIASVALLFLCEWRYGGKPVDDTGQETPFFPFGCTPQAMEEQIQTEVCLCRNVSAGD